VQNFTLLQKRIEISVANSMIKKNTNVFLEIVKFIYGSSREQQIYKDV
jgi:hypothetical protein